MTKALIIGIGNTLRGDDGIASEILRRLESEHIDADCLTVHQLTVEMAHQISEYDAVLFIDASVSLSAGHWRCVTLNRFHAGAESLSHDLSPNALVNLSEQLYGTQTHAQILSIGAENFGLTETISPEILNVLPMIIDFVRAWPLTVSMSTKQTHTEFESCYQTIHS